MSKQLARASEEAKRGESALKQGRLEEALRHLKEALTLYASEKRRGEMAQQLVRISFIHLRMGNHKDALQTLKEALKLHKHLDDPAGHAEALVLLAKILVRTGEFVEAFQHLGRALTLAQKVEDKQIIAWVNSHIGQLLLDAELNPEQARQALTTAYQIYKELDDTPNMARQLTNLALAYLREKQFSTALQHAQQALSILPEKEDGPLRAAAYSTLGLVLASMGRGDEAMKAYSKAQDIYTQIGDEEGAAEQAFNMASLLLQQGDNDAALVRAEDALTVYQRTHNIPRAVRALYLKAQASIRLQQYTQAFLSLGEAVTTTVSLRQRAPHLYRETYWILIDSLRLLFQAGLTKVAVQHIPGILEKLRFKDLKDDQLLLYGIHQLAVAAERDNPPPTRVNRIVDQISSVQHSKTLRWFIDILQARQVK